MGLDAPTTVTKVTKDTPLIFNARLSRLGRRENRYVISVPPTVSQFLDKNRIFQVVIRPLGTVST